MIDYKPYLSVKYSRSGRSKNSNLDCYGLIFHMHKDLGIDLPLLATPEGDEESEELIFENMDAWTLQHLKKRGEPVPEEYLKPGNVMLFHVNGYYCHVGLIIDEMKFIHAWPGTTHPTLERITLWENRIYGIYRHNELPFFD